MKYPFIVKPVYVVPRKIDLTTVSRKHKRWNGEPCKW